MAYLDYFGSEKIEEAHECLRQSVQQRGDKSKVIVLVKLVDASYEMYKMNPGLYESEFLADYHLARKYLETIATDPSNKKAESAKEQKQYVDEIFKIQVFQVNSRISKRTCFPSLYHLPISIRLIKAQQNNLPVIPSI